MSGGIKDLYHPIIIEHNKHPIHFEKWEAAPHIVEAYNPVCGDQFKIYLDIKNDTIQKITFHGYGCSLSKAATSILVNLLEGRSLIEAEKLCLNYMDAINQGVLKPGDPKEFEAFFAVKQFPSREQCVKLSLEKLKAFFSAHNSNKLQS